LPLNSEVVEKRRKSVVWEPQILRVAFVSKYNYIIVGVKSQLDWLKLPHLPIPPPPVTAKQRVVIIPDQPFWDPDF